MVIITRYKKHCVKNVQIRSFFWSEYRKGRTRKNFVSGHFSRSELTESSLSNSHSHILKLILTKNHLHFASLFNVLILNIKIGTNWDIHVSLKIKRLCSIFKISKVPNFNPNKVNSVLLLSQKVDLVFQNTFFECRIKQIAEWCCQKFNSYGMRITRNKFKFILLKSFIKNNQLF